MCLWPLYRIMGGGVVLECLLSVLSTLWWQLRAFACAPSRDVAGSSPLAIKWTLRRNRVSSYFINLLPLLRPRRNRIGPKKNWAVYQNIIYYIHYTLITIIANIIICFHVGLSVRPSRVQVPRSRSLIKFALLSLSLFCVRGIEEDSTLGLVSSVHFWLHFTNFSSYLWTLDARLALKVFAKW